MEYQKLVITLLLLILRMVSKETKEEFYANVTVRASVDFIK